LIVADRVMDTMVAHENFAHFLNIPENAQRVNHLVEDVRYALMEYQVCAPERLDPITSNICLDFITTSDLQQGLSAGCESQFLRI